MVNVAEAELVEGIRETQAEPPEIEGDFSPRKIKIAAGVLIGQSFATSILPFSAMSILLIPLTKEFGWSRTEFSFASTFIFFFGAVSLWPIGRMADKIGVRPVILIGTTVVGLITLAMSLQTKSLPQLYFYYAILGIFGSTGVAYMKIIAALFTQNRGKAMAILGAESSVALALIPLATNALILNYGWRNMYLAFGIVILCVVPILFFTLEEPGRTGTAGKFSWMRGRKGADVAPGPPPPELEGMTIKQALGDWVFWLVTLAGLAGMAVFVGMLTHMVAALIGKGFSQTTAVSIGSLSLMVGIAGTLVGGFAVDRFHTAKVAIPFGLASALGALMLMHVTSTSGGVPMLIVASALGGFAFSAARPMGTYFQTRYFGLKSFTEISAVQFTISNPVTAFAAPVIGAIYDRTHSYQIAFILMMIAPLIGVVVWLVLPKYRYAANIGQAAAPKVAG